jgi:DNA-directed RNA polymerase specialized sigma subunit
VNTTSDGQDIFRQFVNEMNELIDSQTTTGANSQRAGLEKLFAFEHQFKRVLMSHQESGKETYQKFMNFILNDESNMLSARVYFREKQNTFSEKMFTAFHKKRANMLHKFQVNYMFMKWVMENYSGPHRRSLNRIKKNVEKSRHELCESNLPLAINRAKLFWSRVPESHLEYMDLIQAASEGLICAIDKFVPPYKSVFRSVAIGRMTLNMTTDYSATMLKLPPKAKRILYRANKAKRSKQLTTQKDITNYVNESFKGTTQDELYQIESAATSVASIDERFDDGSCLGDRLSNGLHAEAIVGHQEILAKLFAGIHLLEIIEMKVVKLKSGDL